MSAVARRVDLGGVYNVRDLGGYPGVDGRMVRRGLLFRASSLHRLADADAWRDFGASTVIDLRYRREIDAFPLPEFIDEALHLPVLPDDWTSRFDKRTLPPAEFLATVYDDMLDLGSGTVIDILDRLTRDDALPAVFFCMAGKDRTGVVAAVVLSLLGVSEEDIADDFALSGDEVVALVEDLRMREDFEAHPMMNQPEALLRAPRAAMEMFLARARVEHGGLDGWVRNLGVPERTIRALRTNLLD